MRHIITVFSLLFTLLLPNVNAQNQLQPIAIMGAMDAEIEKLLPEIKHRKAHYIAANTYYTGQIQGKPVVVTRSGVGK